MKRKKASAPYSAKRTSRTSFLAGVFVIFVLWLLLRDKSSTLKVDANTVTIGDVRLGEFDDYVRVSGQVQPITVVQVSLLEGGVVEEKLIEEGSMVKKGDVLVRLSNNTLGLQILQSEADLAEQENFLRNTTVTMEQEKLDLEKQRLEYTIDTERKKRKYEQYRRLDEDGLVAREEYLQAKEDYELAVKSLELVIARQKQDSIYRSIQIGNLEESLESMRRSIQLVRQRVENLNVKSPIDGQLGSLDVILGQSIPEGTKIGQVNDLSDYKIEARIDEHYIDRVQSGLSATFERQGSTFGTVVEKVYPEVTDGQFKADFYFTGERPDNIRIGQTYYLNLQLGQPTQSVYIPRGVFYQSTGGTWIYVLSEDGTKAYRRDIRIGRQNPQYYEVLEGLKPGEKVIISNYENYGKSDVLILNK